MQEVVVLETAQVKTATAEILKQHSIPVWISKDLATSKDVNSSNSNSSRSSLTPSSHALP